jgi:hypothetical protein
MSVGRRRALRIGIWPGNNLNLAIARPSPTLRPRPQTQILPTRAAPAPRLPLRRARAATPRWATARARSSSRPTARRYAPASSSPASSPPSGRAPDIAGIRLQVEGREWAQYGAAATSSATGAVDDFGGIGQSGGRAFLSTGAPLGGPGVLAPGQYSWPFKLQLSPDAPPSFFFASGADFGRIKYTVTATIVVAGALARNTATSRPLVVLAPDFSAGAAGAPPPPALSAEEDVVTCCCLGQGRAAAHAALDRGAYADGETVHVALQARNLSSAAFTSVELRLRRLVLLSAYGAGAGGYSSGRFADTVAAAEFPGLAPGEVAEGPATRQLALLLPPSLLGSAAGQYVSCACTLQVLLRSRPTTSSLQVDLPVQVAAASPVGFVAPQVPPGWKPKTFAAVELPAVEAMEQQQQ